MIEIAHRGYSGRYGDNNLRSFEQAVKHKFDMIELDIQLCDKNQILVYHDTYLDTKPIMDYTLSQLLIKGHITLDYVFFKLTPLKIPLFLDIKGDPNVIEPLIRLIKTKLTKEEMRMIYISGFDRHFVDKLNASKLPLKVGFTTENNFTLPQIKLLMKKMDFACFHWTVLDETNINYLKSQNILVFTYTCKDAYIYNYMRKFNIDGIVSNYKLPGKSRH
tara:strand:- start:2888 stop:3544 length:657 start_codon:yes stop_codon:yes gene_type:complete